LIYILESTNSISLAVSQKIKWSLRFFNFSFIGFWLTLVVIGIKKGYWMYEGQHISFGEFQDSLHRMYLLFVLFGIGMAVGLYRLIVELIKLVIHLLNRNNKLIKG
jgi:nitric oxide reductase subunit B